MPAYCTATFTNRENVRWYSFHVTRKDGLIVASTNYFPKDLTIVNGVDQYKLSIGPLRFGSFTDEASMLVEKARQQKMLDDYVGNGIEVRVKY